MKDGCILYNLTEEGLFFIVAGMVVDREGRVFFEGRGFVEELGDGDVHEGGGDDEDDDWEFVRPNQCQCEASPVTRRTRQNRIAKTAKPGDVPHSNCGCERQCRTSK